MKRAAVSAALLLACAALAAQQTPPTFKASTLVVEADVRVFDQDGRFVADLTRDDFEIVEEGVAQRVDAVHLVSPGMKSSAAGAAGTSVVNAAPSGSRHGWLFLFDLNHLTPGSGFDRAKKAVQDYIRDRFNEGDLGGIIAGSKMINNRLTTERNELVEAVGQVQPLREARIRLGALTREWPRIANEDEAIRIARNERDTLERATARACAEEPAACTSGRGISVPIDMQIIEKARVFVNEDRRATLDTLNAINALASGLARIPGPKTIVLLSDGFVTQELETTLRSVAGQATRAGARIYSIDVRGLNRGAGSADIESAVLVDQAGAFGQIDHTADGPASLAVDTGGLMIRNENDIGRALERIAQDSGRYYLLAYTPVNATFDGKLRRIEVRVRGAGLRVRARRGYLALPPAKMLTPAAVPTAAPVRRGPPPEVLSVPVVSGVSVLPGVAVPEAPAAVAPGTVGVAGPAPTGTIRLRPDGEKRVAALAASSGKATDAAAAGWQAYQYGDVESALTKLTEAAARPDAAPWILYALGLSQAAVGRTAGAAESWERVRQSTPEFAPVYIDLADTYLQLGDMTKSLAVLRDAEKRWPQDAELHNAIGVIHARRGALDDAIEALTRATATAPADALSCLNLGRAYELRFARGQRYVSSQRRWIAPDEDRQHAAGVYARCIKLGGPHAKDAAEGLSRMEWAKK